MLLLLVLQLSNAFIVVNHRRCVNRSYYGADQRCTKKKTSSLQMGLGDYSISLEKPLGMILEEREVGNCGVRVKEVNDGGSASTSDQIVAGDIIRSINGVDVTASDFDTVMDLLVSSTLPIIKLDMGDGLGTMDMPPNVVKMLKSSQDAFLVDAVVRKTVREIRKENGGRKRLGDLLKVEVIIGAGVTTKNDTNRVMVRFFAIFSTDGVSSYSCNVSATANVNDNKNKEEIILPIDDSNIKIVSLSCAKDEGLGQIYQLISEE